MKVATWGSKICDDALRYSKNENVCRMVEISPFSLLTPHFEKMQEVCHEWNIYPNNEYLNKIFALDYSKQVLRYMMQKECDYIVINLDSMRLFLREFILSDGTIFRIREDLAINDSLPEIRKQIENDLNLKVIDERVVKPMLFENVQLEKEIEEVCKCIKIFFDVDKLVLLETHNVYQYIDKYNKIVPNVSIVNVVNRQNDFYDRCIHCFKKHINCKTIVCPNTLVGDARRNGVNMFNFGTIYYEYINKCLDSIENKEYSEEKKQEILFEYENKQRIEIEEIILRPIIDLTFHRRNGRKIVLIGESETYEYNLKKKYGIKVDLKVEYPEEQNINATKNILKSIEYKNDEYLCVVPYIKGNFPILELLWSYGYGLGKGYICNVHDPVIFRQFEGEYQDFYNNRIISNRLINLELKGIGNQIYFDRGNMECISSLIVFNQTRVTVENMIGTISSRIYDGATLEIKSNTRIEKDVHIRCTFFSETKIGQECVIEADTVVFNGDGHAIFDLHTGNNINYDLNRNLDSKRKIIIGDNVHLGNNCFVLSGTNIPTGSYVRDNSFVNKVFSKNCLLAGNPAKEI